MKVIVLGAGGFIGTNLVKELIDHEVVAVDRKIVYLTDIRKLALHNVTFEISELNELVDYDQLIKGQDVVFHLISTTVPTTSNQHVAEEIKANIILTANLLEACVRQRIKKIIFISSGGTVYGVSGECPLNEDAPTNPITSYGFQKLTIEKLLYLYNFIYGLDYRIVRLSNPYGPYQRPNGILGVVTTFTYKAIKGEELSIYGDGSVVRDFIYIEDAIRGIINVGFKPCAHKIYNLGSGHGVCIKDVVETIEKTLNTEVVARYSERRQVDVPTNYLDISRYENEFEKLSRISLEEGIKRTAVFLREKYYCT